jgi:hypothetical protein
MGKMTAHNQVNCSLWWICIYIYIQLYTYIYTDILSGLYKPTNITWGSPPGGNSVQQVSHENYIQGWHPIVLVG